MEKTVEKLLLNDSMNDYLTFSKYINGNDVRIVSKANEFKQKYTNEYYCQNRGAGGYEEHRLHKYFLDTRFPSRLFHIICPLLLTLPRSRK